MDTHEIITTEKKAGTGAVVHTGTKDANGNAKVTKVIKDTKDVNIKDGSVTTTTKTVTDKVIPSVNKPKENADGSATTTVEGQTKEMDLPSPKTDLEIVTEEAKTMFKKGQKSISYWIRTQYKIFMRLTMQWRQDEDNVDL
jgi:hypothetical protein